VPFGFRPENEALWVNQSTGVLQEHGPPYSALPEVMDDADDAAARTDPLAALLPPPDQRPRPQRNCGVAWHCHANLKDAANLICEEWEKVSRESIAHCWVMSSVFPMAMSASVVSLHEEYLKGLEADVDEVLSVFRGTALRREVVGSESQYDARDCTRAWL